jgi:uncharacterized OB-fold protein
MVKEKGDLLTISSSIDAEQPYRYSAGRYRSRFLTEIRDNKRFVGVRCPKCEKVYAPPKMLCGPCFCSMDEAVEVGPQGVIKTFTILRFAFVDPDTGTAKPVPYAYGIIQLDGADNVLSHYVNYDDEAKVRIGARVEAVFEEKRKGTMKDIRHFQIID